jgi:hypothetical protein
LEPVVAYLLILLTVAVIALLPRLLASPTPESMRNLETRTVDDPLDTVLPPERALAEVD